MFLSFVILVAVAGVTFPACLITIFWLIRLAENGHNPGWIDFPVRLAQRHNGGGQERNPALAPVRQGVDTDNGRSLNG